MLHDEERIKLIKKLELFHSHPEQGGYKNSEHSYYAARQLYRYTTSSVSSSSNLEPAPVSACIRCGYCCWKVPCYLGEIAYQDTDHALCKYLTWTGTEHACGLLTLVTESPADYHLVARLIHVGAGCCSSCNTWRREPLRDRTKTPPAK